MIPQAKKAKKNKKSAGGGDSLAASDPFAHLFKKKDSLTWPQKTSETTNGSSKSSLAGYKQVGARILFGSKHYKMA